MKQVSIVLALVIGVVIGWALRGATDKPATRAPVAQQPGARPQRPVEDPKAVYRVALEDSPAKGPADALVTIVESSDFECPFCKRVLPTLKQLEDAYAGKVRFVWKHNPLPFHARATPAAIAAEEARAQGGDAKFWAMHDALFASAPALSDDDIVKAGQQIGLDVAKLKDALATRRHADRILRDQRLVTSLGANGTPAFFVNGRKISGALPFESFRTVIDEELAKAEALVRSGTPASQVYARVAERGATAPVYLPGSAAPPAQRPQAPAQPPPAQYRKVELRPDDPAKGPAGAKLTIVLFSDFQCPFCGRVEPTLKRIEEEHRGDVRIVWKHQPLPMHAQAVPAALAAEAAREQGKFWPMHERLFANQQDLSDATLERYAREIGLDVARYKKSVASAKAKARIDEDQRLAASVGATGTPTMFLNCRQVVGALPYERMAPIVDEELKKVDALLGKGAARDASLYAKACEANVAAAPAAPVAAAAAAGAQAAPALPPANVELRPDDPVKGPASAPVTIVVFSDFQCPFCSRVEPTLKQVEKEYPGKVKIAWKHQPLVSIHPQAMPAALAAEAAREQGKFWQMHDKLFENQGALSSAPYERYARELGLDVQRFKSAYDSGKYRSRVEEDQRLAARLGIGGTPTMVVNGERVVGAVPFEQLKGIIDRKLAENRAASAAR